MKILNSIIEILTSPFSILLRNSNGSSRRFNFIKNPICIFLISALIVFCLILFFYRDYIFRG